MLHLCGVMLFLKEGAVSLFLSPHFVSYAVIILNGRKSPLHDFFTSFSNQYYACLERHTMVCQVFNTSIVSVREKSKDPVMIIVYFPDGILVI